MPLVISYINPNMRPDIVQGSSWRQLDGNTPALGTINLKSIGDGHRIIVNKSAVAKVEEFDDVDWDKMKQEQKDAEDAQAAAQVKAKDEQEAKRKKDREDAAAATLAHLKGRTLPGLIKRGTKASLTFLGLRKVG